jgi:2-succinyl-5-enolpyruvyl-6-hydroxy-3-cyclohexene-1-carboxylate synthase
VVGLLGDLAFLHDVSGLVSVGEERGSCTLVVLDNGGGGIFNFLSQAALLERTEFERLFGTPPTTSVAAAAGGLGVEACTASTLAELDEALSTLGAPGRRVVRMAVPTREENVALHDRLHAAVADALAGCGAG